jgi:hypothetical protein
MANEKQIEGDYKVCKKKCDDDPSCKYFYNYKKTSDGKNYCLSFSDSLI